VVRRRWLPLAVAGSFVFVLAALLPAPEELRVAPFDRYGEAIADGSVPYRDFALEYPPGALPPIVVPALVPGVSYEIAFRSLEILLGVVLVLGTAYLLRDARPLELAAGVALVAGLPFLLGTVVVHRFDLYPALLVTASLVALERSRDRSAGAFIGLALAAKANAGAVVPPLGAFLVATRGSGAAMRALAAAALAAVVVALPLAVVAPGGVASAVLRQTDRELQIESVGASLLLAHGAPEVEFVGGSWSLVGSPAREIAAASTIAGAVSLAILWLVAFRGRKRLGNPALVCALAVAVVLVFSKVLSPQFLVWVVPLVALVRGRPVLPPARSSAPRAC